MTLQNLRNLARAVIPSLQQSTLPDTTSSNTIGLDLILNEAVKDIADYTACLPTNKKFSAVASQGDVANPYLLSSVIGNFLTMGKGALWWNAGSSTTPQWRKLNPRTVAWLDKNRPNWHEVSDGSPEDYAIDGDNLYVVPAPVDALTDGFWLFYGKTPGTMSATGHYPFTGTTTELTHLSKFDMSIIYYTRSVISPMLNKLNGENLSYAEYKKEREEKWGLLKRRLDIANDASFKGPSIV